MDGRVSRAAPLVKRPPSPPYIHIPSVGQIGNNITIVPKFDDADSSNLTREDLEIITQGKIQMAAYDIQSWRYESRREAQPVLDFLYLGPSSIANNRAFLEREGITMLLAARDSRLAGAKLMTAERTAQALGLAVDYIDVSSRQELIRSFPLAVHKINDHLVRRYRSQELQVPLPDSAGVPNSAAANGPTATMPPPPPLPSRMLIDSASFSKGKVLLFCETGNDRSAAVAAAYLMTMFRLDLVTALQFIQMKRFCTNFDDETKFLLRSYEDILGAQRSVNESRNQQAGPLPSAVSFASATSTINAPARPSVKRRIADAMSDDEDYGIDSPPGVLPPQRHPELDGERYVDRDPFAPFVDHDVTMA